MTPGLEFCKLESAWITLAERCGATVYRYGLTGDAGVMLRIELGDARLPAVLLAAGVHGDEPAGPWALLELVQAGLLDPAFRYQIWPCTNPSGYVARTRENTRGEDVNRSFHDGGTTAEAQTVIAATERCQFLLALDFHEDYEAEGFYLYEPLHDGMRPIGGNVVEALQRNALPLHGLNESFDLGYRRAREERPKLEIGRVLSSPLLELDYRGWPLGTFLLTGGCERVLTFETPQRLSWDTRVKMHVVAAVEALAQLRTIVSFATGTPARAAGNLAPTALAFATPATVKSTAVNGARSCGAATVAAA